MLGAKGFLFAATDVKGVKCKNCLVQKVSGVKSAWYKGVKLSVVIVFVWMLHGSTKVLVKLSVVKDVWCKKCSSVTDVDGGQGA